MKNIQEEIADIDWQPVTEEMNEKGYALVICGLIRTYL